MAEMAKRGAASMNAAEELLGPPLERGLAERPAILFGDQSVSYADLDQRANRFGHVCLASGVEPQDRVLLLIDDRPEFFYAYLGAMKTGAVPVALNLRASAEELLFAVNDSRCRLLVLDARFLPLYGDIADRVAEPPPIVVADRKVEGRAIMAELMHEQAKTLAPAAMAPDDMALWMYTSGTTGKPKAAVHTQRAIPAAERFLGEVLGVGPGDRLLCSSKLFFAYSLGHCLLGSLRLGAATVLCEGWPSEESVAAAVERHRPTLVLSVPTLYRNLLRGGRAESPAFRSVRHYVAAGERLPEALFRRWLDATGRPIIEGVGATETLFLFVANRPDDLRPGASGIPTLGTEVRLLDERGRPVTEPGARGILWVRADCLADRYWNQEEKTRAAFRDGWYCTGDVFTRDADGWFRHRGRSDDMLKISGQWVSPAEIEERVMRNPQVAEAVVVGVPDADGLVRLALFLVVADESVADESVADRSADHEALERDLIETLTAELAVYKCPRQFFYVDEMPRTATGKVQRFALRGMAADRMDREA